MTTKFYPGFINPGYTPASWKGAWDKTSDAVTVPLNSEKDASPEGYSAYLTVASSETSADDDYDVALLRLVSAPLDGDQTISGTLTAYFGTSESSSDANFSGHMHAWVTEGDSDTVRGTLVTDAIDADEWKNGSYSCQAISSAISPVNALSGDRIVIEIGYQASNTSTTSYTGTIYYGSFDGYPSWADLADGDDYIATPNRNPWISFSNDVDIDESDLRISQVVTEVAVEATDPALRFSQASIEVAVVNLPPVRFSQVVIEVATKSIAAPVVPWNPLPTRCQATYWANLYDFNGNLVAVFDDFKPLTIEHRINGYSNCTFSIDGLDSRISLFKLDYILEVWRDIGDLKYIEFEGVHRSDQLQYTEGGHWIYTSYSRSFEDFLMRRCVMYRNLAKVLEADGVTWHGFTLKKTYADDAMKEFVNENLGPGANNHVLNDENTRLVNGTMPNFNIEANTSQGPIYVANFAYLNLLEVLQKIAAATGVDFKVRRYSGNQFEFYTRYPMLGSDKSATLIFSPEYGNMSIPSWTLTRTEEVNVVATLGQGENTYRRCFTFERASTMDSPWNRRETTHDSSGDDGQAAVDTGNEVLNSLKAKEEFTFQVMQTDASAYGYDYVLGDVCTVKFGAITKQKKVTGIVINVSDGKEDIKVSFSDYPTVPPT